MSAGSEVIRRHVTPGRIYTSAIVAVVVALLAASLPRLHGVETDEQAARAPVSAGPAAGLPSPLDAPPLVVADPAVIPPSGFVDDPTPTGSTPAGSVPTSAPDANGDDEPVNPPCGNEATVSAVSDALATLDTLALGAVPSRSTTRLLAIAVGCNAEDPAIAALAFLLEVGDGIPDPGLDPDVFPVLPAPVLPDPLIELLQPARPVLDPVCSALSTVGALAVFGTTSYPVPVNTLLVQTIFAAAAVCGQLQQAGGGPVTMGLSRHWRFNAFV